uniref:AAA+ ATPase domain-containing protein n=1 Tax=Quercus lobata TaxID=97700 RepID=A0A7N2ML54_QUELO
MGIRIQIRVRVWVWVQKLLLDRSKCYKVVIVSRSGSTWPVKVVSGKVEVSERFEFSESVKLQLVGECETFEDNSSDIARVCAVAAFAEDAMPGGGIVIGVQQCDAFSFLVCCTNGTCEDGRRPLSSIIPNIEPLFLIGLYLPILSRQQPNPKRSNKMEFLTETVKVFVEKTVGYTIAGVGRQIGYLRYKKNVDILNNKFEDLKGARDSVQRKVQAASYNVEEIEAIVQRWQTRVQGITAEVEEFVEKEGQAKLKCFNLKARYQIGKKAHKMGLNVKELKDEADTFHTVGHRVPIEGGTTISTKGYEDFESRKSIFDGVMEALKDDNIPAIGVCGMGGLGKTMLVGKIATQAMKDKLFERIVTVVVSQTPNLKQIQKDIAKELELKFEDEDTDFKKAHLLRERLKKEKILLIVDDIWNKIDLDALGISFGDNREGSKLLLTSRFRGVLDKAMDVEKIFQVEVLSNEEAKFLFVKIVGDFAETLNFQSTMVEVVKECAGLPIAITTVANTLKNQKNPNVWKDALQQLKRANPTQINGMHEKIFGGFGLLEDVYKMEEVRNRVHTLVEILKDSCLLLESYRSGTFKMHDVIRDVAIHIADKEKKMLTIRSSDDLEKWSNMKKMNDSIGIALFETKFSELPARLECPQLNFIILGDKENSLQIPNHIFEGAKNLKVLVLMRPSLPLPSSLSLLQNLQTLALLECKSEDLALIGELKNLKALVLVDSKIKQLPIGIRQLTHLQLLDLRRCTELEAIPSNVISNLKNLEEIHMNQSFNQWQVGGEITERSNARVSELDHLLHLTTLCIHIPNPNILPNALPFKKLVRYEILIGPDWDWDSNSRIEFEISRTLKIDLDRSFQEEDGIKILLKGCEYLTLAPGKGIKNILYEVDKEGFPRLKHLYVQNSVEIQYIIDSIWFQCVAFPVLELLSLVNMINLEKICHNQLAMGSFHNLRKLEIRKCDNLVFVFSSTLLRCFSQLQEIEIEDCKVMSAIVAEERKHGIQVNDDIITDTINFPQLRSLNLKRLPNLMGFCSNVDSQSLFNKKVAFSNLENLHIDAIYKLEMLWHNQLDLDSFCKLKQLRVDDCVNLINIFQPNILRRLSNLEDLQIRNCNLVEDVFEVRGKNGDEICDMVVSTQFKVLKLINLPNLKHIWSSGPQAILTFQNLHEVEVSNCKSMKSLFPTSVAKSLKQLKKLKIHDCGMEEIVAMEEGLETVTKFVFPQLVSLSLELMPELKCFYPGKHTIEWPSLKQLMILKCDKVNIVALNELSFPNTDGLGHDVPIRPPFFQIEKVWTCTCFFVDMDIKCLHCIAFILDGHCLVDIFFPLK